MSNVKTQVKETFGREVWSFAALHPDTFSYYIQQPCRSLGEINVNVTCWHD